MKSASLTVKLGVPEPTSETAVFYQGQAFFFAGNRCLLELEVGPGVTQCLVSAGVVNLCLSIELFLKSLLVLRGGVPPKHHKLVELLNALPTTDADAIRKAYSDALGSPAFDDLLSDISDYFVRVRYGYEFDVFAFHETPVYQLARSLYAYTATTHGIPVGVDRVRG